jgi:hypothetical protein
VGGSEIGVEGVANYGASSGANALRLKATLTLREAGALDEAGNLTESAIDRSFVVVSDGSAFNNQSVIDALINDGSNIADWQKLSTESVELSTGQRIQVHYYRNQVTGEVNYTHSDFKVKNPVNLFPRTPQPEPTINPPYKRY